MTDFIEGQSFSEFCQEENQEFKKRIAEIIWVTASHPINIYAMFNADPHPGNYLIVGNKVAMVDFGFCKKWKKDFISNWKRQILAACDNNLAEFELASIDLGLINTKDILFYKHLIQINQSLIQLPWLYNKDFHFTGKWVKEYLEALLKFQIMVPNLKIPADFLALSRLYWGLFNLMVKIDVGLNIYKITIPYVKMRTIGNELLRDTKSNL